MRAALSSHFLLFVTTKSTQIASSTLKPTEKKMCKISDLINLSNLSILQGFKIPNQSVTWQLFGFLHSSSDQLVYASFIRVTAVDAHKPPVFISAFCFRVVPHLKHTNHSIFFLLPFCFTAFLQFLLAHPGTIFKWDLQYIFLCVLQLCFRSCFHSNNSLACCNPVMTSTLLLRRFCVSSVPLTSLTTSTRQRANSAQCNHTGIINGR